MASTKTILSAAASVAASAMLIRTITQDFVPYQLQDYFFSGLHRLLSRFSSQLTLTIEELEGFSPNQIFEAAEIYLGNKFSSTARRLKASKPEKDKNITITMERDEEVTDIFEGIQLKWTLAYRETESRIFNSPNDFNSTLRSHVRYYLLSFHQKHKDKVLNAYLSHVLNQSKDMKEEKKGLKIHTLDPNNLYGNLAEAWSPVNLDHPATFQTLAMEPELKEALMADLDRFVERRDYYKKVGKAWKRGYLLYGPPGTGKSSLIAAMANYLNFNIYDLELSEIRCNSELRKLLVAAANRSILVVEDIDCTIDLQDREGNEGGDKSIQMQQANQQVTLSGFLNFIDGLWSSCGDERIIIFTTNHKEKLDPALLRPGRMDFHIHMSYCTPGSFKVLASNYLALQHHPLFEEIEALIQEVEVTPAQVAEELMKHQDPTLVLEGLLKFLGEKKMTAEEGKNVEGKGRDEQELKEERVELDRKEDREEKVVV